MFLSEKTQNHWHLETCYFVQKQNKDELKICVYHHSNSSVHSNRLTKVIRVISLPLKVKAPFFYGGLVFRKTKSTATTRHFFRNSSILDWRPMNLLYFCNLSRAQNYPRLYQWNWPAWPLKKASKVWAAPEKENRSMF